MMRLYSALLVCALSGGVSANAATVYTVTNVSQSAGTANFSGGGGTLTITAVSAAATNTNDAFPGPNSLITLDFTQTGATGTATVNDTITFTLNLDGTAFANLTVVLSGSTTHSSGTANTLVVNTFSQPAATAGDGVKFTFNTIAAGGINETPGNNTNITANAATPEPATMGMMGASLLGLAFLARRSKKK